MNSKFNLSELAVKHRTLTLYFLILSLIVGTFSFFKLGRAEDPTFTIKVMVVSAVWPGATAKMMQNQVADPIEKKLQEVRYFDKVETTARPGRVDMLVQFKENTPASKVPNQFYQVRKRMLDLQPDLPKGVQGPLVNDTFSDVYFTLYSLTRGHLSYPQWLQKAEETRNALLQVEGVQKVNLLGEQKQQISIELNAQKLKALGATQNQIFEMLAANQAIASSGFIETQGPRIYLRPTEPLHTLNAIKAQPLLIQGQLVHLGDIAKITRGFVSPPSFLIRNQGKEALLLGVVMRTGFNGLTLSKSLTQFGQKWQAKLPKGIVLEKVTNQGDAISLAVETFQLKFFVAVAVVMLVSFLTLGFRAGIIVALAIPVTLALTFFVMYLTDKNLDRVTLGALILALGLLVDDAIISIEMMLVKMEEGMARVKAAAYAWTVTASPMLFGTLVTVMGFVPIGFAASNVGEYAGNIFWILLFALSISWLVAVTFTPFLGERLLPNMSPKANTENLSHELPHNIFTKYLVKPVEFCVKHRLLVVVLTLGVFALAVMGMKMKVAKQFFPTSDRPELMVDINLPEGTSETVTNQLALQIEHYLKQQPEAHRLTSYIGRGAPRFFLALNPELPDPAFAKIIVVTPNAAARKKLKQRLNAYIAAGHFNQARVRVHALLYGPPVIWPVTFRVEGEDLKILHHIAEQVRKVMSQNPNTRISNVEWGNQVPVIHLQYHLDRLAVLGLTPLMISEQCQQALNGQVRAIAREGTRQIELTSYSQSQSQDLLKSLNRLVVTNSKGLKLPLEQVATLSVDYESPVLKRRNRIPYMNVNAEVVGAQPPDVTMAIWKNLQPLIQKLPQGYQIKIAGSVEQSGIAQASIQKLMPVMILLMVTFVMLNMQSFSGTLMVVLTAPLGLIGAVLAMILFHQPFGFVANLGLIGLAGILMRNTLILVGQIHENLRHGMDDKTALIDATLRRSRPVLLTALAAVLAFIPLTSNTFWGPMAYVLIGGIGVGTLLTLLFLPAFYALWYRIK